MKQYSCIKRKNNQSPLKFTSSKSPSSIILGLGYIFKLLYMCLHESYFMMALWVSPILMRAVKKILLHRFRPFSSYSFLPLCLFVRKSNNFQPRGSYEQLSSNLR